MSARTRSRVKGANRLVKVRAKEDADVTVQTAEFDAGGRRIKKVVTNAGDYDKTEVYFYNGQQIVQINNGSGAMVQQFIHGTQYIDELVMMRVKDKGDLYVHQDANWNVIGVTDLGRHVVERSVYTPYGELTVHQDTGFGDRDGDQDVDSTDKGTVGTTCTGTVSGSCRILDLDFDGDYDSADATKFDALAQGAERHPGRPATAVSQPFAHQGLLFEPELAQYQNRAREYDPARHRFAQRDPEGYSDGMNLMGYGRSNPARFKDWTGALVSGIYDTTAVVNVLMRVVLWGKRAFDTYLDRSIWEGAKQQYSSWWNGAYYVRYGSTTCKLRARFGFYVVAMSDFGGECDNYHSDVVDTVGSANCHKLARNVSRMDFSVWVRPPSDPYTLNDVQYCGFTEFNGRSGSVHGRNVCINPDNGLFAHEIGHSMGLFDYVGGIMGSSRCPGCYSKATCANTVNVLNNHTLVPLWNCCTGPRSP